MDSRINLLRFCLLICASSLNLLAHRCTPAATLLLQSIQMGSTVERVLIARHVISYLHSPKNLAIEYSGKATSNVFTCASDSAFGDDNAIDEVPMASFSSYVEVLLIGEEQNRQR